MNPKINRSYDITVYPFDEDDACSFSIKTREISDKIIRILLTCYMTDDCIYYLGTCENCLWFVDPDNYRGLTLPFPSSGTELEENFEEIEDYDEELCCILSETVYLLYHDILSVNTAPTKPEETYEPVPEEPELPFLPF